MVHSTQACFSLIPSVVVNWQNSWLVLGGRLSWSNFVVLQIPLPNILDHDIFLGLQLPTRAQSVWQQIWPQRWLNECEGNRGICGGTVPEFTWRNFGSKWSSGQSEFRSIFEPRVPTIRSINLYGKYFMLFAYFCKSRDCVVSKMARLRAGRSGLQIPTWAKELPLLQNAHIDSGAHPSSHSISAETPSKGIKKPRLKADRSPPSSTEIKNEWR